MTMFCGRAWRVPPLSKAIGNLLVEGAPASVGSSDMALLCRSGLSMGDAIRDLDFQIPVGNHRILKQQKPHGSTQPSQMNLSEQHCQCGSQEKLTRSEL